MSESDDQWCKLVEQQLFRLESKQTALRGVVAYLAKRCGMNAGDFWQLITLADKAVYQQLMLDAHALETTTAQPAKIVVAANIAKLEAPAVFVGQSA